MSAYLEHVSGVVLEVDGQRAVAGEERRHVSQDVRAVAADLCLERRDSLVDTVFVPVVHAGGGASDEERCGEEMGVVGELVGE